MVPGTLDVSAFRHVSKEDVSARPALAAKLPAELLCDEFERYLLNAPFVLPINVYVCEIWVSPQSKNGEAVHRTIAFCQRVEAYAQ